MRFWRPVVAGLELGEEWMMITWYVSVYLRREGETYICSSACKLEAHSLAQSSRAACNDSSLTLQWQG